MIQVFHILYNDSGNKNVCGASYTPIDIDTDNAITISSLKKIKFKLHSKICSVLRFFKTKYEKEYVYGGII